MNDENAALKDKLEIALQDQATAEYSLRKLDLRYAILEANIAMLQKLLESALSEVPMGAFSNDKIKIFQKALTSSHKSPA